MLTIGLIVEGTYDEAALGELVRRCVNVDVEVIPRNVGGKGRFMGKFLGFLEEFRYVKQGTHVGKALVVRDADGKEPRQLLQEMQARIAGRAYPFPVHCIVIVQALETWLLADRAALAQVANRKIRAVRRPLERIPNPKQLLNGRLGAVPYTYEVARSIAARARLEVIERHCPRFRSFRQAVIDC